MSVHELIRRSWIDSNKKFFDYWHSSSCNQSLHFNHLSNYIHTAVRRRAEANRFDQTLLPELSSCLKSVLKNGFYKFDALIPENIVNTLKNTITNDDLKPELPGQIRCIDSYTREQCLSNSDSLRFFYSKQLLSSSRLLTEFIYSNFICSLASSYFCSRPFMVHTTGWLSKGKLNSSSEEFSNAAQEFHFDVDAFKFLKIFIYLSDVDTSSGAHQFYSGSHLAFPSSFPPLNSIPAYFRTNQETLSKLYSPNSLQTMTGKQGTIIIEDTSGFHRGLPLLHAKTRDVVIIQLKDSHFSDLIQRN